MLEEHGAYSLSVASRLNIDACRFMKLFSGTCICLRRLEGLSDTVCLKKDTRFWMSGHTNCQPSASRTHGKDPGSGTLCKPPGNEALVRMPYRNALATGNDVTSRMTQVSLILSAGISVVS